MKTNTTFLVVDGRRELDPILAKVRDRGLGFQALERVRYTGLDRNIDHVWYVNGVEVRRCYGGSEEGGWYYHEATPVRHDWDACFRSKEAADYYAQLFEDEVAAKENAGRRPLHSVLSNGRFEVRVTRDAPAEQEPKRRPRYE